MVFLHTNLLRPLPPETTTKAEAEARAHWTQADLPAQMTFAHRRVLSSQPVRFCGFTWLKTG